MEVLSELVPLFGLVAVISGRPTDEVRGLVGVEGVRYVGSYGIGEAAAATPLPLAAVEEAASHQPGAMVEPKGVSVAVHYRASADPLGARDALLPVLGEIAGDAGFVLIEGKMVIELVPSGAPHKGDVVQRLVHEVGAETLLYAGDDLPDLDAFAAVESLTTDEGMVSVKVAVLGEETPVELQEAADIVVEGPEGLVALLRTMVSYA